MAFHQPKCGKLTQNIDSEMVGNEMDAAARFFYVDQLADTPL